MDSESASESMIELLIKQSDRIDSQRAELPARVETKEAEAPLPGLRDEKKPKPDDDLLDIIERVQGPRLDDQRTVLPRPKPKPEKAQTMPEDDFFSRLMRAQASRMEEQRATIPLKENRANKADSNAKK